MQRKVILKIQINAAYFLDCQIYSALVELRGWKMCICVIFKIMAYIYTYIIHIYTQTYVYMENLQ